MNELVIKVAHPGEGKTQWLLDVAHKYRKTHNVYFLTNRENEYERFCEKYFATYNTRCLAELHDCQVGEDVVVLIDDYFQQSVSPANIKYLQANCHKVFITITGSGDIMSNYKIASEPDFEQLTIDMMGVQHA